MSDDTPDDSGATTDMDEADRRNGETPPPDSPTHATCERQARENREDDPPA